MNRAAEPPPHRHPVVVAFRAAYGEADRLLGQIRVRQHPFTPGSRECPRLSAARAPAMEYGRFARRATVLSPRHARPSGCGRGAETAGRPSYPLWITGMPGTVRKSHSLGGAIGAGPPNRRQKTHTGASAGPTEASVNVHYLHASDGVHLVVDRNGRRTRRAGEMRAGAIAFARDLMAQLPHYPRWDEWSVYVYDEAGECEMVPFAAARDAPAVTPARDRAGRTRGRPASPSRPTHRDNGRAERAPAAARSGRSRPAARGSSSRHDPAHP